MALIYLGIFFLLLYTAIMIIKTKAIPSSISETYYLGGGIWFTITLFVSGFLFAIGLLDLSEGRPFQFLSFLTSGGILFVGAAPHFHDYEKLIHYGGATMLMAGSQLWLSIFASPWLLLIWLLAPLWVKSDNKIFWCEITCICSFLPICLFF